MSSSSGFFYDLEGSFFHFFEEKNWPGYFYPLKTMKIATVPPHCQLLVARFSLTPVTGTNF